MMAAFADMVDLLGRQGIAAIPTKPGIPSVPMVKNPGKFGVRASRKLLSDPRYMEANVGIWAGKQSNLTVVDIDSKDPACVEDAIKLFGDTPVKVATPSGGTHLYYRHGGESRLIRPFGRAFAVDVLGGGLAAAPPSERHATATKSGGKYRLLEGHLGNLCALPSLKPVSLPAAGLKAPDATPEQTFAALREGDGRDRALFRYARTLAVTCERLENLRSLVLAKNAEMAEPLSDAIASAKADQAWRYKEQGRLIAPGSRAAVISRQVRLACSEYPSAYYLIGYLMEEHSLGHVFALVPEAVGPIIGMGHNTVRQARDFLVRASLLKQVAVGGLTAQGRKPNLYQLTNRTAA